MEPEENEAVIGEFLKENADFRVGKPKAAAEVVTDAGFVRTSPAKHEMDGFFAAILERQA
jgi:16S rRNA C967 or C1407 C5-methylase (RsmB/RsmF family)